MSNTQIPPNILLQMSETDRIKALELLAEIDSRHKREAAQKDFLEFVKVMWPEFIHGSHHAKMARAFERVARGELKRLIINMPPRHTKSEFASNMLPAWFLGLYPHKQVMQISHTADMAEGFGRKVRNLVDSDIYNSVFPNTRLRRDSTAAARWNTDKNGVYIAMGVGGAVAGKGADLLIIDDPISEQEGKGLDSGPFDAVYDYYMTGPRQRLQPGGAIIVVMTRWNKRDLTGRLVDNMLRNPDGDQWEVIEFPAILPSGQPLWPEFWKLEELEKTKISLDNRFWQAQYQQNPTSEEGAIVKREWWQRWEQEYPPDISYTLLSWDTAFEKHNRADYSALTVWGVFYADDGAGGKQANIILLDAVKKRVEFPELKQWAYDAYQEWTPDSVIIEKRASGASLIQELRRSGIPVQEYTPTKGNDKISRLNSVADIFASGMVWAPETRWADELIDDVASFPAGTHDDLVDTVSQALLRFRQGGFVSTQLDEPEEERYFRRKVAYY
jgi:predicted phage terminase large subunit-like protein